MKARSIELPSAKDERHWLTERIKTSRNLCNVALLLMEQNRDDLLPTVLETLFEQAQIIIEESCIKGEKNER